MRSDPQLRRMLRDATREAAQDLENLKLVNPEHNPAVAALKYQLRDSLAKNHKWIAEEARSISRHAKQSSARHREELVRIKKTAREAAANVAKTRRRGISDGKSASTETA